MKKLLYFVVSLLSLSVIFAAGWASGVGTVSNRHDIPTAVRSNEITEECPECPDNGECPEHTCPKKDNKFHRHSFRIKLPFPPFDRDSIIKPPKAVS